MWRSERILLAFVCGCLQCLFEVNALELPRSIGPVSQSLGGISASHTDPFVLFNQPAIMGLNQSRLALAFQSRYFMEGMNRMALVLQPNLKSKYKVGLGILYFGNGYYNEQCYKIAVSRAFSENFSAGIGTGVFSVRFPEGKSLIKGILNAGISMKFNSKLQSSVNISNVLYPQISSYQNERFPLQIQSGLGYKFSKNGTVFLQHFDQIPGNGSSTIGCELIANNTLVIRVGYSLQKRNAALGISFKKAGVNWHLAFQWHPYLGSVSDAAVSFTDLKWKI